MAYRIRGHTRARARIQTQTYAQRALPLPDFEGLLYTAQILYMITGWYNNHHTILTNESFSVIFSQFLSYSPFET